MRKAIALILLAVFATVIFASCGTINVTSMGFDKSKIGDDFKDRNIKFAFNIFRQVNTEDSSKNIFISPLSISTALAMTYQGAEGTTREAMAKALELSGLNNEVLNESYKNLLGYLKQADSKLQLDINNSIWTREGKPIKKDFLALNKSIFDAYVTTLDFSEAKTADTINKWIDDSTKGKIKKMIDPPIPSDIIMYLINAIYFKGQWSEKFSKDRTFDSKFNSADGKISSIKMMSRNGTVDYAQGEDFKGVRLPYGKGKMAMYCILPEKGTDINAFIRNMDFVRWAEIRSAISETKDVKLQIPRFNLEYGIKNLNDALTSLGMGEAFSDNANFSGIGDSIAISRVLHKAVIEVDEEGSTAAGVTVVEMKETAVAMNPPEFIADRPFIFVIADDDTGSILFIGKLMSIY
ncbi:MAG: serpin family protein [Ruminiclostridium sp.]|nr:serpin family protein [Ruminiclostridium sp.]